MWVFWWQIMIEANDRLDAVCLYLSYLFSLITTPIPRPTSSLPFECFNTGMLYAFCLWPFFPLLLILMFFFTVLCEFSYSLSAHYFVSLSPLTTYCLQVTKWRIMSKLPIILVCVCSRARKYWWYLSWWTFLLRITLLHNHHHIKVIDII